MSTFNTAPANLNINYTVSFPEAQAHYINVEMFIQGIRQAFIDLKLPVWTPGSYMLREFAKHLEGFEAKAGNVVLVAKKTTKNSWRVQTDGISALNVSYRLYSFEISVRTNFVNTAHGFISSAATFLYPDGMLHNPSTIFINPYKGWDKVSTGLEMIADDPFKLYAPDYDTLFDSPIEVGTQDIFTFEATGVKYEVAMCMGGNYNRERLIKDLTKIAEIETAIFGENPNKRYIYMIHNYAKGIGGLEHLNSTVLGAQREGYTNEDIYQKFLSLAAHEHFHLWNVKRLRPMELGPFNYDAENYTTELWIAEGFTNYYDNLIVHRMGLYPTENYLDLLAGDINLVENAPGNKIQTLAEASFDAWIKFYRPNENSNNSNISYYTKGGLLAMMLDLEIIHNSGTTQSLDDVMKYMYTEYYQLKGRGYTAMEFKQGLEKFTGTNLDEFYEGYVYGLTDLDYDRYLGYAGLQLADGLAGQNEPLLGITINANKKTIATVIRGGSGWIDGLNVNDELTAIDGNTFEGLDNALAAKSIGDKMMVSIIRDTLPFTLPVTIRKQSQVKYHVVSIINPSAEQLAVRFKWLKQ
jgi:predicted metalloprotease with PDZ domain